MRYNYGQCIPANIIAQEVVDYVKEQRLDPSRVLLWLFQGNISCGIHVYPQFIKRLLESYGDGMEEVGVYVGDISFSDITQFLVIETYFAYLFGGLVRRLGCRIRPYEKIPGSTDSTMQQATRLFVSAFSGELSKKEAVEQVMAMFDSIPCWEGHRPKAAIFGDFYVRDNEVLNQNLIKSVEQAGGEVITTSFSDYMRIIADAVFIRWRKEKRFLSLAKYGAILAALKIVERQYRPLLNDYLSPPDSFHIPHLQHTLDRFSLNLEHSGESFDNTLKVLHLAKMHPDLALFIQASPAFCCPSLVTEAMSPRIEEVTGVPVVSVTYDGTGSIENDRIIRYLKYPR